MVKGFDPTTSDISSMFLNYLFSQFQVKQKLNLSDSQNYVNYWLQKSQYTSQIYRKFQLLAVKPRIILKKQCKNTPNLSKINYFPQVDKHFPTMINNNDLIICLNKIENKVQLKQNLDRQLTFLYNKTLYNEKIKYQNGQMTKQNLFKNEQRLLIENLYESCLSGYKNYSLSNEIIKNMAITCTKYLFFRRSTNDLPIDRKFRYTTQLADELLL